MPEWVKILILAVCFFAFVGASGKVIKIQRERSKEVLLKAFGYELEGNWWKKPGYSLANDTVNIMSVGRLADYLERWEDIEKRKKEE